MQQQRAHTKMAHFVEFEPLYLFQSCSPLEAERRQSKEQKA